MIKWFAYIVLLLIMAPAFSSAKNKKSRLTVNYLAINIVADSHIATDTTSAKNAKHQQEPDDKKKVKEIGKAKRQPKPEKIVPAEAPAVKTPKPKRERRPEGLERPPEIPRRNGGG